MAKISNISCVKTDDCTTVGEYLAIFLSGPLLMILVVCYVSRKDRPNLEG